MWNWSCATQDSARRIPSGSSASSKASDPSVTLGGSPDHSTICNPSSTTSRGNVMKNIRYMLLAVALLSALICGLVLGFDSMAFQTGAAFAVLYAVKPFLPTFNLGIDGLARADTDMTEKVEAL